MEITRNSVRDAADSQIKPSANQQVQDGVASFTNAPPTAGDLHRPRAVRHPSPTSEPVDLLDCLTTSVSRNGLPHPFNGTSSPLKKGCHTSTGQHLHQQYGPVRSLANGLPESQNGSSKKSRTNKQVTFQTEARLIGEAGITLPVVFESDQEEEDSPGDETESLMPGFVNVPCSRRGFCLELDSVSLDSVGDSEGQTRDEVDRPATIRQQQRRVTSPEGCYDWQPSYVNLEDTEIAPVLLASSRPADDSSDFWKPRSVASGQNLLLEQPVYDAPNNSKASDDNPLLLEFPGFRYAIQLPGNVLMERRSISNGSSGSDTQVNRRLGTT